MSDHSQNLDNSLSALWHNDSARDGIVLIAKDPERRELGKKLLQPEFQHFQIMEAESRVQAVNLIAGSVKGRVAMIIDFNCNDVSVDDLRQRIAENDAEAQNVPHLLVVNAGEEAEDRDADAVLTMPFNMNDFRAGVAEAILKRSGKFEEAELNTRLQVLREFCEYYLAMVSAWTRDIVSTECFRDRTHPDIYELPGSAQETLTLLESLDRLIKAGKIDTEVLRAIFHDFNNKLSPLIGYTELMLEEHGDPLHAHDVGMLQRLFDEVSQMAAHISLIMNAYNERCSWKKVQCSEPTAQLGQKLECEEGTSFCVIDDDQGVLTLTKKTIEVAGGKAVTVNSKEALEKLFEVGVDKPCPPTGRPDLQVFLLDNNLGGGVFGHELIAMIRENYPQALIIAHTSDAASLNADSANPYSEQGVEVVGKRAWHAISGAVRRTAASGSISAGN